MPGTMPGEAGSEDLIRIGYVGKPHGVRGGFYVEGAVDPPALAQGLKVKIDAREYVLTSRAGTDTRPIIAIEGVSDRDAAVALRGETIYAERALLTPLAVGEWYASDLEGMTVISGAEKGGGALGTVAALRNLPSVDVLEVAPAAGGPAVIVPMVADAIVSIDPKSRTIVVDTGFLAI